MAGLAVKGEIGRDIEADAVINGGTSVWWPDQWPARDTTFADRWALVEKRGACLIVSEKQSAGFGHPRGGRDQERCLL
jgi:hypothetical protein